MATGKTVLVVVGTRPEAIKMAPVIQELRARPADFTTIVCSTGQHRHMLEQSLGFFGITPDVDLRLMSDNQTLGGLTSALFTALGTAVDRVSPEWILAQGDTASVMVAGLIAYYHRRRLGHVEAGLRTEDKFQPFPEEMNRRIADQCADLFFAPTEFVPGAERQEPVASAVRSRGRAGLPRRDVPRLCSATHTSHPTTSRAKSRRPRRRAGASRRQSKASPDLSNVFLRASSIHRGVDPTLAANEA